MQVSDLGLARPVGSYAWQLNIAANLCSFARKRGWTAGQDVSKRIKPPAMSDPHIPEASSSPEAKDAEASDAVDAMESSDGSESDEDSASPRARSSYVVDNESGVALLLETRCRHGASSTLVSAWRCGKLVWEHQIRGSVEHTTVAQGFVAFATRTALHLLSTVGGYALFPPMVLDSPVLQLDIRTGGFLLVLGCDSRLSVLDLRRDSKLGQGPGETPSKLLFLQTELRQLCEPMDLKSESLQLSPAGDLSLRLPDGRVLCFDRSCQHWTIQEEVCDRLGLEIPPCLAGSKVLAQALHEFTLPPEVVLFEPSANDIHRGGTPAPEGKPGISAEMRIRVSNRLIFLNVPLLDFEQKALESLHDALKDEKALAPLGDGVIPSYVRLHALRQSKLRVDKALSTIATHLEMRVQKMPVHEESVLNDLKSGMMLQVSMVLHNAALQIWRMEKITKFDADRATRMILFILEFAVRYLMVPGRVENWDLAGCGLSMAAASSFRTVCRNVTRLLEEVYCGRNFTTKIFHMPSIVRAIVNSLIPEDKKSKVEFVADADIAKSMRQLCEANQLEEQYGGSPPLPSLHDIDRSFHEGFSLDLFEKAQAIWRPFIDRQPLTKTGAETVSKLLARIISPTDARKEQWLALQSTEAANKYAAQHVSERPTEAPDVEPEPVSPTLRVLSAAHLQHLHQLEAAKSNELEAQKEKELEPLDFDFSGSLVVQKEEAKVLPVIETEAKAAGYWERRSMDQRPKTHREMWNTRMCVTVQTELQMLCVVCGRAAKGRCSTCRSVYYCSESCQLLDWFEDHAACCQEDRGLSLREDAALLEEDPVQQATEVATAWEPDTDTPPRTPTLRPPSPPTADDFTPEDEAVELWRQALSKLSEELYDEDDLEDLADLEVLVASAEEMLSSGRPRCELVSFGPRPVLLTAPHCLALLRDGQSPHLVEKHTIEIASGCARFLNGSVLSWSALERRRTELLWRLSKRVNEERGRFDIRDGFLLDPRNRDPNFLATSELKKNAWFQQIRKLSEAWSLKFGMDLELLHVDVHGCQDPPNTPSHLTVGLGAMCFHAIDLGDADAYEDAICFGNAVCRELSQVLAKAQGLRPRAALVRLAAPGPEEENCAPRFSGAWRGGRHTQSQQAIKAGFSHAVQLELSKSLRAILATDEEPPLFPPPPAACNLGSGSLAGWGHGVQGPTMGNAAAACCCAAKDEGVEVTAYAIGATDGPINDERFQGSTQKQYAIAIRKKEQLDQLGMDVKHRLGRLVVVAIRRGGAVDRANLVAAQHGLQPIQVNDVIVDINGATLDTGMVAECKSSLVLNVKFLRREHFR
ncbi:hypothetical protein AK812_SmicGene41381 [Symbiodinium microadriaticum]|uniref:MYND-type domain-containing protein n=2 Tax=Symbiodinium TaxID=2949 RepID=A0A1Q9C686_SYMMI|nr:hypothetical protein AK812_SmicGene41381 [Symbiodinium microadriaticum]